MAYVGAADAVERCIFCAAHAAATDDPPHYVLERGRTGFLILNAFPYASGHLMAVVNRHVASPEDLDGAEQLELMQLAGRGMAALRRAFRPQGFNLGVNVGRAAGAGIEGHLHLHVVPRWVGDTNFMPVLGAVKVLPESLEETFRRLRGALRP
jgi:ATP adenylyltransferase